MIKSTWWILYYASKSCLNNHGKLIDLISDDSNNFSFNHMLKIKQHIQLVKFLLLIVFGGFFFSFFVNCALRIILILISNESFVYFIVYWWIYAFEGNVIFNILFNLKNTTFILHKQNYLGPHWCFCIYLQIMIICGKYLIITGAPVRTRKKYTKIMKAGTQFQLCKWL